MHIHLPSFLGNSGYWDIFFFIGISKFIVWYPIVSIFQGVFLASMVNMPQAGYTADIMNYPDKNEKSMSVVDKK